jgi:hypothetical protein
MLAVVRVKVPIWNVDTGSGEGEGRGIFPVNASHSNVGNLKFISDRYLRMQQTQ